MGTPERRPPRQGLAVASLVLGILSLPTVGLVLVGAMAGVALGVAALVKASRSPAEYGGRGFAIAGIATSAASIVMAPVVAGIVAAIAIPALLRSRVSSNERQAIAGIRRIVEVEAAYARGNGGFYDTLACLERPAECRDGYEGSPFLDASPDAQAGYVRVFHAGAPAPPEALAPGLSSSSLVSCAVTAVPEIAGQTGVRGFCGDSALTLCATRSGAPPAVSEGRCLLVEGAAATRGGLGDCLEGEP